MSRRQNPEEYLWPEMVAALRGLPRPDHGDDGPQECDQSDHHDLPRSVGSSGSNNWGPMAASVRYARTPTGQERRLWVAFFVVSRERWMGRELDSTTYDSFHVCAVLMVAWKAKRLEDSELYAMALAWLKVYAARAFARFDDYSKRVLAIGQRSAGHDDPSYFADDFLRIGRGYQAPDKWRTDARDKAFLWACSYIVQEACRPFIAGVDPVNYLENCGVTYLSTLHIHRTSEGLAAWHDPATIHGSTQSVPAAVSVRGKIEYAPARRGANNARLHRKPGAATVTCDGATIRYTSPVFDSVEIPLPPGKILVRAAITGRPPVPDSGPIVPDSGNAPVPLPAEKPKRKRRWWEFWK